MKQLLVAGAMLLSTFAAQAGCSFNWHHYGDNRIRNLLNEEIGAKVPDQFCPYAKEMEIVVISDAMMLGTGCVGYAMAGLRKRNSKDVPISRKSSLHHDTACRTIDLAQEMAKGMGLRAVENVMLDLDDHISSARGK